MLRLDYDPDTGKPRDPNAHKAIMAYADSVEKENPTFALHIRQWINVIVAHSKGDEQ